MTPKSKIALLLFVGTSSALITAAILRNGMLASADSWAYWEGSVSILEEGHYRYLRGATLRSWPPLFSLYLAAIQFITAKTGWALILATVLSSACNGVVWMGYVLGLHDGDSSERQVASLSASALFVICFVPLCSLVLLAQNLMLVFVGASFWVFAARYRAQSARRYLSLSLSLSVCLTGAVLAHNSAVAFIGAIALSTVLETRRNKLQRLCASLTIVASLIPWVVIRFALGQTGSHSLEATGRNFSDYSTESVRGLGEILLNPCGMWMTPSWGRSPRLTALLIGACALMATFCYLLRMARNLGASYFTASAAILPCAVLLISPHILPTKISPHVQGALGTVLLAVILGAVIGRSYVGLDNSRAALLQTLLISYLMLLTVIMLTGIGDSFRGRFLYFVPLVATPILVRLSSQYWILLGLTTLLLIGGAFASSLKLVRSSLLPRYQLRELTLSENQIRPSYLLSTSGGLSATRGVIPIVPPTYPWTGRWEHDRRPILDNRVKLPMPGMIVDWIVEDQK